MSDASTDLLEVFDTNAKTISPLKDPSGASVRIPSLVLLKYSCPVLLDDDDGISMFICGGEIGKR